MRPDNDLSPENKYYKTVRTRKGKKWVYLVIDRYSESVSHEFKDKSDALSYAHSREMYAPLYR